jgi:hypothetical protein
MRQIMSAYDFDGNFGPIGIECGMSPPTKIGCS